MTEPGPTSWFLILYSVTVLGILVFVIRNYANHYRDLKDKIHTIHVLFEELDTSLNDDALTKEEVTAIVKRCLFLFRELI